MATVTIRNYAFPIYFSYKGWCVKIIDDTGYFSMKDLKVKVNMVVDSESICRNIAQVSAKLIAYRELTQTALWKYNINNVPVNQEVYQNEYNRIIKLIEEFANKKGTIEYSVTMNGSMMDRFFGQNISAVKKMCQKVIENIDKIYGDVQDEFLKTL